MVTASKYTKQDELRVGSKPKRQGRFARAYEWFLELPVPIVLGAMWFAGVTLISFVVLVLYFFWLALKGATGS